MRETWVLTLQTSLSDGKTTEMCFDSFEKARDAFRQTIRQYAFTPNAMFDGEGNIIRLREYLEGDDEETTEDGNEESWDRFLSQKLIKYILESLRKAFSGNEVSFELPYEECDDGVIEVEWIKGMLTLSGTPDGREFDCDPDIRTNMFSMKKAKAYELHIVDMFGQCGEPSQLHMELKKQK